ncbi:DedA family protein [Nostocoides sp. HKS02]|uniref:DedA family protein n=1 Tax=Nostocoides sp. HKS02 TaxID=1813880 RepID=UPI0012B491BD|nr:VTT domain-containing protein [Tetrasphaera sp. HKS02]QGN59556.1 DedA family protein [Tetrasphaera sp. HKS02]
MHSLSTNWMDPQWLLTHFGSQFFWVAAAIVFVECGLLFPLLPGDSLLFAIGLFISTGDFSMNLVLAMVLLSIAAFAGNVVGYEIGRAVGTPLYQRDGRVLKKKYFDQSHAFFEKHGAKALVIGRFVPVVRTFITLVAGVSRMDRRHFLVWSAVGAVGWVWAVTLLGYFLGKSFPALKDHLELAILGIVLLSLVPMVVEVVRARRSGSEAETLADERPAPEEVGDGRA